MVFSSVEFLFYFLPVFLLVYFIAPSKLKNSVILLFSLIFYFFGEQLFTLLLFFSAVFNYVYSILIEKFRKCKASKALFIFSIAVNLGLLGYFKYFDFFIKNINSLTGASIPILKIALPVGISFFTFKSISYTIDIYRGEIEPEKNFINFFAYEAMFTQITAGPIERYKNIASELHSRIHSVNAFSEGIRRFIIGLSKKVLLANQLETLVSVFRASNEKTVLFYWIYAVVFGLQIYFDFSGYSDMAIGIGRMMGFHVLENFNYPYISKSITEFWRRWHISLGTWFRDYVYIPMGGNRVSTLKWLRNLLIVWLLTGLWHGADWTFILWGVFIALFVIAEKLFLLKLFQKVPVFISRIYFYFVIFVSFVIFNGMGIKGSLNDLAAMFGCTGLSFTNFITNYYFTSNLILLIISVFASTPIIKNMCKKIETHKAGKNILNTTEPVFLMILLVMSVAYLIDGSFNPFLYFRF